ncbi:MAG: mitochondrial inner membrane protease subunit 2 [Lasallia pustulata]|uniref:Mitochondrial inner membrane protease subunit 2 n=1 Tax=Lasallia pustulata TaxID=136370 RepID=A0A5M8PYS1_9LECA|nr:MAG: mitochondrial inner membrane protease subunit 2 [Lasallia pustulata]
MVVKRVVALEGDVVATRAPYPFAVETVPLGHVWVEGEHPEARMSLDSNTYGPISKSLIAGKVKGIVWPFAKAGLLRWEDYKGNSRVIKRDGAY